MAPTDGAGRPGSSPESLGLVVRGQTVPAELFRPEGSGPFPAVAVGQEATGPNAFIRRVAGQLAEVGYMTLVPDYYHGTGPADPDDYDDIAGIFEHMAALDFRQATYDLMAAADHLKAMPEVDAARLAVWGYCTGATMALLTASLRADLSAAVLFYPSQPRFESLEPKRPVHPVDMVWNISSPLLLLVGEDDPVWPAELRDDVALRLEQWGVEHVIRTYPGAGHAFCSPGRMFHHPDAEAKAWADAMSFLGAVMTDSSPTTRTGPG